MPLAEFLANGDPNQATSCFVENLPSGKVAAVFVREGTEFAASILPEQTVSESYLSQEDQRVLNRELLKQGILDSRDTWTDAPDQKHTEKPVEFAYVTPKSEVVTFSLPYDQLFDQIHDLDKSRHLLTSRSRRREALENADPEEMSKLLDSVDLGPSFAERCAKFSPVNAETERGHLQVMGKPDAQGETETVGKERANPDNEAMLLCDFHNHSTWSDGLRSIKEQVDFYGQKGFDVVCITDHLVNPNCVAGKIVASTGLVLTPEKLPAYLAEIEEMKIYAKEKYGMILMAGVEVNKDSLIPNQATHLLCIDLKGPIDPSQSLEKIADQVHSQGGVTVVAHPDYFWNLREGAPRNWEFHTRNQFKQIDRSRFFHDGWEIANSNFVFPKVAEKVEELGLTGIGDSDSHFKPHHLSTWRTVMFGEKEPEEIKLNLRKGEVFIKHDEHDTLYIAKDLTAVQGGRYNFQDLDAKQAENIAAETGSEVAQVKTEGAAIPTTAPASGEATPTPSPEKAEKAVAAKSDAPAPSAGLTMPPEHTDESASVKV